MFARVITFQGVPGSVDGPIRFALKTVTKDLASVPGFLGILDFADREAGRAVTVTLWATAEARAATADLARARAERVAEESLERVISVDDYEVGHYVFTDEFLKNESAERPGR
jgi:heme-degrading monooxygenase HmoA